jgi:hypothetical protein
MIDRTQELLNNNAQNRSSERERQQSPRYNSYESTTQRTSNVVENNKSYEMTALSDNKKSAGIN